MQGLLATFWLEYKRAVAAEQCYWRLRQSRRCGISRNIFQEFYASASGQKQT